MTGEHGHGQWWRRQRCPTIVVDPSQDYKSANPSLQPFAPSPDDHAVAATIHPSLFAQIHRASPFYTSAADVAGHISQLRRTVTLYRCETYSRWYEGSQREKLLQDRGGSIAGNKNDRAPHPYPDPSPWPQGSSWRGSPAKLHRNALDAKIKGGGPSRTVPKPLPPPGGRGWCMLRSLRQARGEALRRGCQRSRLRPHPFPENRCQPSRPQHLRRHRPRSRARRLGRWCLSRPGRRRRLTAAGGADSGTATGRHPAGISRRERSELAGRQACGAAATLVGAADAVAPLCSADDQGWPRVLRVE